MHDFHRGTVIRMPGEDVKSARPRNPGWIGAPAGGDDERVFPLARRRLGRRRDADVGRRSETAGEADEALDASARSGCPLD